MAIFISRLASARRTLVAAAVCAAMSSVSAARDPHPAHGREVTVASCADDGGPDTLRAAIAAASDGDTIDLQGLSCSVITLTGPLATSLAHLTIVGPGSDALTIDGNDSYRVLLADGLDVEALTIANGRAAGSGACILANHLTLTNAVLSHCVNFSAGAAVGGGAFVSADLTMHHASIVASGAAGPGYAMGGAAFVGGTASLYDSTISGNTVQAGGAAYGGGISANGAITLHASTIEGNSAQASTGSGYGGGLHSFGGDISVLGGSTITSNSSRSDQTWAYGGGISAGTGAAPTGIVTVRNSTVTGNSASSACTACIVSGAGVHAFDSVDSESSTFSYNEATCDDPTTQCSTAGGGIAAAGQSTASSITLRNSTVSGNNSAGGTQGGAFGAGGGIMAAFGLRVVAHNSTIAFNNASTLGGGIAATTSAGTPSELVSTIVADNHNSGGAGDIGAGPFANDLILEGSHALVTAADSGVILPADTMTDEPLLLPLTTANGGVTATHALAEGSPAIDTGANPDALTCDQRGSPHLRVNDGRADIGAYESVAPLLADGFDPPPDCS